MMIRIPILVSVFLLLGSCQLLQPGGSSSPDKLPPVGAAKVQQDRTLCEARGGHFGTGAGEKGLVCFMTPPDAGKICHIGTDCSGHCLARSGTCSPVEPLLGCQEIIDNEGRRMTQCLN